MNNKVKKEKLEVINLIKKTFLNFKFNLKETLVFEMFYRLLALFILWPINYVIIKYFMNSSGFTSISNSQFIDFALSVRGIICIGVVVVISFCMIFFEIGALTYIGVKSHNGEKVRLLDGAFNSFSMLKDTMDRGMIPLVLITGVIGPLTGIGLCSSLIRNFTIPPFITIELKKTLGGKALLFIGIAILVILLFRWCLAIPILLVEKIKGRAAIKKSHLIYKKNKWKLFRGFIIWIIVIFLIGTIATGGVIFTGATVGEFLGNRSVYSMIFLGIMVILFYVMFIFFSLISTPLFVSYLVELYYALRSDDTKERDLKDKYDYKDNKIYKGLNKFRKLAILLTVVLFVVMVSINGYNVISKRVFNKDIMITAHRGASKAAPENSMSSIKKAVEQGADYAEIDVQTTKDNEVVLFHDNNLKRIAGSSKKIKDLTYEEISKLDAGSYFSKEYKNERIPKLEDILKYSKGKIKLNIELKPMGKDDNLVPLVLDLINKYDMKNDVVITSIDFDSLMKVESLEPALQTGYIVLAAIGDFEKLHVDFFSIESTLATPQTIYALHALNKGVHVFTINSEESTEKMIFLGVDNIITDNVPLVKDIENSMREDKDLDYVTMYYEAVLSITRFSNI